MNPDLLPFWRWKKQQIDTEKLYRPRAWYYAAYGRYCQQQRSLGDETKTPGESL